MNCKLYQRHNIESEGFPELFGEVSIKLSPRRNAYKSQQKLENPEEAISEDMNLIIQKQQN
jgi:BRCT domain type II-containing protein